MPELPEVETTMRGLATILNGQRIQTVTVRQKKLRMPLPARFAARLTGARVTGLSRRAKYILVALDIGETLLVHLGMSGRLTCVTGAAEKHDHVIITLANGTRLAFNDPRRFGLMDLCATAAITNHKLLRAVGTEPLDAALTPAALAAKLTGKKTSIKAALLDQRVVAGLGNIYVSEALFWAGISPLRQAGTVTAAETAKLVAAIKKVLRAAIRAGGTSMRNYVQANGNLGFFQDRFAVYDRAGQPCPGCTCGGDVSIKKLVQGGRSSYYCPVKQR